MSNLVRSACASKKDSNTFRVGKTEVQVAITLREEERGSRDIEKRNNTALSLPPSLLVL